MYAQKSPEEVAMDIDIVATESDITVKITADTKTFDVLSYRQRLGRMASDKQLGEMEWADFVKGTQKCRGFHYANGCGMSLCGCDGQECHALRDKAVPSG